MEQEREFLNVIRGLLSVQRTLTGQVEALFKAHYRLVEMLAGEMAETGIDSTAIQRARAEIEQLERLFQLEPPNISGGNVSEGV